MHKLVRALKAAVLLIAALPLATVGNHAVGLAPAQVVLAAAQPSAPATTGVVVNSTRPASRGSGVLAAPRRSTPTDQLQRAVSDLQASTDAERRDDLREDLEEELEDLEADLDDLEADLDDRDAELDDLRDSKRKIRAEERLRILETQLSSLQRQVRAIRSSLSLEAVRDVGVAITALRDGIRALDQIISRAPQDNSKEEDDEGQRDDEQRQDDDDENN